MDTKTINDLKRERDGLEQEVKRLVSDAKEHKSFIDARQRELNAVRNKIDELVARGIKTEILLAEFEREDTRVDESSYDSQGRKIRDRWEKLSKYE